MPKRDFTAYEFVEQRGAYLHVKCAPGRIPGSKPEMQEFAQMHAPEGYTAVRSGVNMTTATFSYRLEPQAGYPEIPDTPFKRLPGGGRDSLPDYV